MIWSLLGGGVQPEGNRGAGGNPGLLKEIMDKQEAKTQANNAAYQATVGQYGPTGNVTAAQSAKAAKMGTDSGFYNHMTVNSARSNVPISGDGDVFHSTKEDKAFKRSSNMSNSAKGKPAR